MQNNKIGLHAARFGNKHDQKKKSLQLNNLLFMLLFIKCVWDLGDGEWVFRIHTIESTNLVYWNNFIVDCHTEIPELKSFVPVCAVQNASVGFSEPKRWIESSFIYLLAELQSVTSQHTNYFMVNVKRQACILNIQQGPKKTNCYRAQLKHFFRKCNTYTINGWFWLFLLFFSDARPFVSEWECDGEQESNIEGTVCRIRTHTYKDA